MSNISGKPLTDVLGEIENGEFLRELTAKTYDIIRAVMMTRKAGALKINLAITPTGKGTVNVDATFAAKEPEDDRPTTTFFVGRDFSLQRNDPNQPRLPLREVADRETGEIVSVEAPTNAPVKVG